MTHPISQEVQRLADGLTKAQRQLLLDVWPIFGGDFGVWHYGRRERTFKALVERGLAKRRVGIVDCLTPLGIALRDYLKGSTNDQ